MATDPRVDEYLAALPAGQRVMLQRLREHVARLTPEAVETISYGMPTFKLDGRFLLSFAGWKHHCSVYPINDALVAAHADTVGDYGRTKGSLHFTSDKPLPDAVVEDLVHSRVSALQG